MNGKWKLRYVEYLPGIGILPVNVELIARQEKAAILEARAFWKMKPKRDVEMSPLGFQNRTITFPHSPQLNCLLDHSVDPHDRGGKPVG